DSDGRADTEPRDAPTELVDDAGALVAEGEPPPADVLLLGHARDERVAEGHAGGGDLEAHLAGAGLGGLDLHDLGAGADRAVLDCLHADPPSGPARGAGPPLHLLSEGGTQHGEEVPRLATTRSDGLLAPEA